MYLRRTAAALGGILGLLHLVMLIHGGLVLGLVMAAAAVTCLPCAGHLWRNGSVKAWTTVGAMNLVEVVLCLAGLALSTKESKSCRNESTGKHAARRLSAPI